MMQLQEKIEQYYEMPEHYDKSEIINSVNSVITMLNNGEARIINSNGSLNLWVKKAILLMFRYTENSSQILDAFDKIGLLPYDIDRKKYRKAPGALIRNGVYIGSGCVIMPSYINIGAYIDDNTMIDINASVGSCAQIGKNCHISAGTCIGGVLEPMVANPVIIEDNCFIGANSAILEGCIVKQGAIIASGLVLSSSTKIIFRETGEMLPFGLIPANSVVVPGTYPSDNGVHICCAIIIKKVDAKSLAKSAINKILREET